MHTSNVVLHPVLHTPDSGLAVCHRDFDEVCNKVLTLLNIAESLAAL